MSELNRAKLNKCGVAEYLKEFTIPWEMITPHEEQCKTNHQQTLVRIAQRGGLSRCEAIVILEDRQWKSEIDGEREVEQSDKLLKEMVEKWKSENK